MITAVVLAAGFSSRFGSDKRLASLVQPPPHALQAPYGEQHTHAKPVIVQTLENILATNCNVLLVHRHNDTALLDALEQALKSNLARDQITTIAASNSDIGQGTSIANAMQYLARQNCQSKAVMICLADMPFIQTDTYQQVIDSASADHITRPTFKGKAGHPVCFGEHYFEPLSNLSGDSGAKSVITSNQAALRFINVNDSGVVLDIDSPEDIAGVDYFDKTQE